MIFVTTGTTTFPFTRADRLVTSLLTTFHNQEVLYQSTTTSLVSQPHLQVKRELPFQTLVKMLKKADIVVAHGGPGTFHLIQVYHRFVPFILPRLSQFHEHVNDHQMHFATDLAQQKKIILINENDIGLIQKNWGIFGQRSKNQRQHSQTLETFEKLTAPLFS